MKAGLRIFFATIPALAVIGFFTYFSNWIPQTEWKPPERREISATLTPAELSLVGQGIVRERGCLACHTLEPGVGAKGQGRGPNLSGIALRRAQGVAGGPDNLTDYLVQALYQPGAYLVEGYADIMPPAISPPAKLSYEEVVAAVDYLQSLGGRPTVRVGDIPRPTTAAPAPQAPPTTGVIPAGEARPILDKYGCLVCHSLGGQGGSLGPALDNLGLTGASRVKGLSAQDYLRQSILSPGSYLVPNFPNVMPADLGNRMSAADLEALASYLASLGRE